MAQTGAAFLEVGFGKNEVEPENSEAFDAFAHDLCGRYRYAWRGARRLLSQHLEDPEECEPALQGHPEEPTDADICCYIARLQPAPAQANKWFGQALKADPGCVAALIASADDHRRAERFSEAARCYRAALQQKPLPARSLYRLGEVLVQSGRGAEGRRHLRQVLQEGDVSRPYQVHAAVTMALSYAMDQRHECTLQYCQRAEELHEQQSSCSGPGMTRELRLVRTLRGLTQLRRGDPSAAVRTLQAEGGGSARGSRARANAEGACWHWDELVQSLLGHAETLQGNYSLAEVHLECALQCKDVSIPGLGSGLLVSAAYLRLVQGDFETARELLQRALQADRNSPTGLLHMGYLLLCQSQFEKAAQFLQKCLQQPVGSLAYGAAEKGAAHLYLCLALHWRNREQLATSVSPRNRGDSNHLIKDHFRHAYELQPDLRNALLSLQGTRFESNEAAAALLVTGSPKLACRVEHRMGIVDLTLAQALVVLFYAEECGAVRVTRRRRSGARSSSQHEVTPRVKSCSPVPTLVKQEVPAGSGCCSSLASTLAATASTATPTSVGSSRASSEFVSLFPDAAAAEIAATVPEDLAMALQDLSEHLSAEKVDLQSKVLAWNEIGLDRCMSRGEFAIVSRGRLARSGHEVVVKTMDQKDCTFNEQAARGLLEEIRVLAGLSHPRVVVFAGACLEPTHIALVTELAPGGNLHQALHVRRHPFSTAERFQLAIQLLEGVRYLHMQRPAIAHLDLKSTNLVLDADCQNLRICDFGLARRVHNVADGEAQEPLRSQGGSARYMAPECYDSNLGPVSEKADVWSTGCILIEIFGSCLPYAECSNLQQILKNMLVHRCGPSIPASIEANVRGAIAFTFVFEVRERLMVSQVLVLLQTAASSAAGRPRLSRSP